MTTTLPHPAVVTHSYADPDPVTEDPGALSDNTVQLFVDAQASVNDFGEHVLTWDDGDEIRGITLPGGALVPEGDELVSANEEESVRVRAVDPYDAVMLSPAGVAQPVEVIQAEILRGSGQLAQELDALVAPDNTVVTLMLETGQGVYVRFSGDWQKLGPNSTALDDLAVVEVAPSAVDVFDAADAASTTLTISDLPIPSPDESSDEVIYPVPQSQEHPEVMTAAAGVSIPAVDTADDLDLAVRYARTHPEARWYVIRRARALGLGDMVPPDWVVRTTPAQSVPQSVVLDLSGPEQVRASAQQLHLYQRSSRERFDLQREHAAVSGLLAAARWFGLLDDPAVIAVAEYREWLHPRGHNGQYIEKFGTVNIFQHLGEPNGPKRRAKVTDLTPDGIKVEYADGKGGDANYPDLIPVGDAAKRVEVAAKARATLGERTPAAPPGGNAAPKEPQPPAELYKNQSEHDLLQRYAPDLRAMKKDADGNPTDVPADPMATGYAHTVVNPDGSIDFTPERQALHEQIMAHFLEGKTPVPEGQQANYRVLGGGPAAGKSTLVKSGIFPELQDKNAVEINADEIKGQLPEYQEWLDSDDPELRKNAARRVHEESSYLSQLLTNRALDGNYDAVLDGTGDSSVKSMQSKLDAARERGYAVNGYYTTVPTDEAIERALVRGEETGRFVPEEILRGTHAGVSKVLPDIYDKFDNVSLYDTTERDKATPIMSAKAGEPMVIHDPNLWQEFLDKAQEDVAPLSERDPAAWEAMLVRVDAEVARRAEEAKKKQQSGG